MQDNATIDVRMQELVGKPVRSLQTFLRAIEIFENDLPAIIPDGIFGPQTEMSVREFQLKHKLRPTGKVDYETWQKIVEMYLIYEYQNRSPERPELFPAEEEALTVGNTYFTAIAIKAIMKSIADQFKNLPQITTSDDVFCEGCEEFVRRIQELAGLEITGKLDRKTWDIISRLYSLVVMLKRMPQENIPES